MGKKALQMSVFTGFLLHFILSFVAVFVLFWVFFWGDCCFLREGVWGGGELWLGLMFFEVVFFFLFCLLFFWSLLPCILFLFIIKTNFLLFDNEIEFMSLN